MAISISCTICDSRDAEVFREMQNWDPYTASALPLKTVSVCRSCGNIFQSPCLPNEEMMKVYCEHEDKVHGDYELDGVTRWENLTRVEVLRDIARIMGRKGRLLEIGCSEGSFLFGALEEGFECHAVEPSRSNIARLMTHQRANRVSLWQSFFESCSIIEPFDVITHYYVLEHSYSPKGFLEKARSLIHPSGVMFFEVPDLSRFHELPFAIDLFPSQHISHFYHDTIQALLRQTGWELVDASSRAMKPTKSYGMSLLVKPVCPISAPVSHYARSIAFLTEYFSVLGENIETIRGRLEPTLARWIASGKDVVIFGAGENGRFLLEYTTVRNARKLLFCDSDKAMQGRTVLGIHVISPQELAKLDVAGVVIASLDYQEDMIRVVASMGIPHQSILSLYEYSYRHTSSPSC